MTSIYKRLEDAEPGFEKELDDAELEQLYDDALLDYQGDRARHYPEKSLMQDIIEEADTVEGTEFLNKLRDELSARSRS